MQQTSQSLLLNVVGLHDARPLLPPGFTDETLTLSNSAGSLQPEPLSHAQSCNAALLTRFFTELSHMQCRSTAVCCQALEAHGVYGVGQLRKMPELHHTLLLPADESVAGGAAIDLQHVSPSDMAERAYALVTGIRHQC